MRDAERWALEERANIDIYPGRLAEIIREAQLDGVRYVHDTIMAARDDFAKPMPTLKFDVFEALPQKVEAAIVRLDIEARDGWVRVRDIGRALRSTPREALEGVLACLVADGVLEHKKIDRHQGKGQMTDAYRITAARDGREREDMRPYRYILTIEDSAHPGRKWTEKVSAMSAEEAVRIGQRFLDACEEYDCTVTGAVMKEGAQ